MPLTSFCGGVLFGERTGTEPHVLALHGWARDHRDWSDALRGLAAIAVDLPGFGTSPPPPEPWGSEEYAKALLPILDSLSRPVVVVGHSFGGRVALHLAATAPHLVDGLVLSGVPLARATSGRAARTFRVAKWLHQRSLLSDSRMEAMRVRYGSADYRAADGVLRAVLVRAVNENYDELLPTITCPVELVWGQADTAAPVEPCRRAAALIPRFNFTTIPDADHFACFQHPDVLREAIARAGGLQ